MGVRKSRPRCAGAARRAIATAAVRGDLRDFKPQELANTAWAFAKADRAAPTLFDAIAREAVRGGLRDFKPQELSMTASWAFATAGHAAPVLLDAIATQAVRRGLREFNAQDLANVAWAFATAGHAAPTLLDAIATGRRCAAACATLARRTSPIRRGRLPNLAMLRLPSSTATHLCSSCVRWSAALRLRT